MQSGTERRSARRRYTNLKTTVTLKGLTIACRVVNVSAAGAVIAASFHPPVGARLELDLPGYGSATAVVSRVTSAYIAIAFDQPVDVDAIEGAGDDSANTAPSRVTSAAL